MKLSLFKKQVQNTKKCISFLSGGVDSAVATAIYKKDFNYSIQPVYFKNWIDEKVQNDEITKINQILKTLNISKKLIIIDCLDEYKKLVFDKLIDSYQNGNALNVDVVCDEKIRFDVWLEKLKDRLDLEEFEFVVTGDYARIVDNDNPSFDCKRPKLLLQATDKNKCQVIFLSRIDSKILPKFRFPIGNFNKNQVKFLANSVYNLKELAIQKESTGGCFIGNKRKHFREFLNQNLNDMKTSKQDGTSENQIFDLTTNQKLGKHTGIHNFSVGQKPKSKFLKFDQKYLNFRTSNYVNSKPNYQACCIVGAIDSTEKKNNIYLTTNTENLQSNKINSIGLSNFCLLTDIKVFDDGSQKSKLNNLLDQNLTCQFLNRQTPLTCKILKYKSTCNNEKENENKTESSDRYLIHFPDYAPWILKHKYFAIYGPEENLLASAQNLETGPNLLEIKNNEFLKFRDQQFINFWSTILEEFGDMIKLESSFQNSDVNQLKLGTDKYFLPGR